MMIQFILLILFNVRYTDEDIYICLFIVIFMFKFIIFYVVIRFMSVFSL